MNIQHKVLQCPELFIHDLSTALHRSLVMQRETNQTQKTVALEPEQLGAWVLDDGCHSISRVQHVEGYGWDGLAPAAWVGCRRCC